MPTLPTLTAPRRRHASRHGEYAGRHRSWYGNTPVSMIGRCESLRMPSSETRDNVLGNLCGAAKIAFSISFIVPGPCKTHPKTVIFGSGRQSAFLRNRSILNRSWPIRCGVGLIGWCTKIGISGYICGRKRNTI